MATTYTGRVMYPTNFGVPSPLDVAVQSFRIPRFAGSTRRPWTVGHHLLACDLFAVKHLLRAPPDRAGPLLPHERRLRSALLTHDAEELCTGDIPTTWKVDAVREMVLPVKLRIWEEYSAAGPLTPEEVGWVKGVDRTLLLAEAHAVAHENFWLASGFNRALVDQRAVDVVETVLRLYGDPADFMHEGSVAVTAYLTALLDALGAQRFFDLLESMGQRERTESLL
jgi:hypothetical protein